MPHTSGVRKTKAITELEQLLGTHKSTLRTKLLRAAEEQLNVLELEVANLRLVDTGTQPSLSYMEIAARLANTHENPNITEPSVRLAANAAREVWWNVLSPAEQTKLADGSAPLPKPTIKFILGLETD